MKRFMNIFLAVMLTLSALLTAVPVHAESVNLISNPSVELATADQPQNFSTNSWGGNTAAFSYEPTGRTGGKSLKVTVSNYTDGDAKWMSDQVAVTAGTTYTYSDYSQSNVSSELCAAFTTAAGVTSYVYIDTIAASATWQLNSATFTAPAGVVSMSMFHILAENGWLQTDDFSIVAASTTPPVTPTPPTDPTPPTTPTDPSTTNLIANASFETVNGADPAGWNRDKWGTNTSSLTYTSGDARTGTRSATATVTAMTSGDTKWYATPVSVTAGTTYTYSDFYKATVPTRVVIATTANGVEDYIELAAAPAATSWAQYTTTFVVPTGVTSLTMYHLIDSVGTLSIDDVSLTSGTTPTTPSDPTPPTPPAATNLIANPSFETANGTDPANWNRGGWGTNTANLTYVSGTARTGTYSARASITAHTDGDAKWYATPVTVTPGSTYTYSDYYTSDVTTRIVIGMTANGVESYTELASAPTATTWAQYSATLTIPTGVTSLTIFHLIDQVGTLTIDDVSLTATTTPTTPTTPTEYIANPSFETASGTMPAGWTTEGWGNNTAAYTYVNGDAHTGTRSAKVTVSNYVDGDAKWVFAPINTLTPGNQYTVSAWYKTNAQPHMVAAYEDASGNTLFLTLPNPLPAANASTVWQQYTSTLNVPAGATNITLYFLLSSNGWLQVDDYQITPQTVVGFNAPIISLTFDDAWRSIYTNGLPILNQYGYDSTQYVSTATLNSPEYMTTAMVQAFKDSGHEIDSHTVNHADLPSLTAAQLDMELKQSQETLRLLFGADVANNFASPYGKYNTTTLAAIDTYYGSHRSTDTGYNTKNNFNSMNILVQNILTTTTPAEVAAWVDKAKADKAWLVLVYHQVLPVGTPEDYNVTPSDLNQHLLYIQNSGVQVQTVSQALTTIQSQL